MHTHNIIQCDIGRGPERKKIYIYYMYFILYYFVCFRTGKTGGGGDRTETRRLEIVYTILFRCILLYRAFLVAVPMDIILTSDARGLIQVPDTCKYIIL